MEILAGLVAGFALLVGIGLWRLSTGPVSLSFLTPAIQESLKDPDGPFDVSIGDTVLTWAGWDRAVDIMIRNVTLRRQGERPVAVLPRVSLGLSLKSLVNGVIAPTSIEILSPAVAVRRYADGRFAFGLSGANLDELVEETTGEEEPPQGPLSLAMLDQILNPTDSNSRLAELETISVLGATTTIVDDYAGVTWRLPDTNIVLVKERRELRGNISVRLETEDTSTSLSGVLLHAYGSDGVQISVSFQDLSPGLLARAIPEAAPIRDIDVDVSGSVSFGLKLDGRPETLEYSLQSTLGSIKGSLRLADGDSRILADGRVEQIDTAALAKAVPELPELKHFRSKISGSFSLIARRDGFIEHAEVDLTGSEGVLSVPEAGLADIAFRAASLSGRVEDNFGVVVIDNLSLDVLEETAILVTGSALSDGVTYALDIGAQVLSAQFADIMPLWPDGVGSDAKDWLEPNLPAAYIPNAEISLRGSMPVNDPAALEITSMDGAMDIEDAEVHYRRPLPPVTGISGRAVFGVNWMKIDTTGGTVEGGLELQDGVVHLTDLGGYDNAEISIKVKTPLQSALTLLDSDPFHLISKLDIDPSTMRGTGVVDAYFAFPLSKTLTTDEMTYRATARATDVEMDKAPLNTQLTGGTVDLWLDNDGMDVSGTVQMNRIPALVNWRESFSDASPVRSSYSVKATLSERQLRDLVLDTQGMATGLFGIALDYNSYRDGRNVIDIRADLRRSTLTLDLLPWKKERGIPGNLTMTMKYGNDGPVIIENLLLSSADFKASGSMTLAPNFERFVSAKIDSLSYQGGSANGTVEMDAAGKYRIDVKGESIDVAHFLEDDGIRETPEEKLANRGPRLDLKADFEKVTAGPDRRLNDVQFSMAHDGLDVEVLALRSRVDGGGKLSIDFRPAAVGQTLSIKADNAGRAMAALDWTDRVEGGTLSLQGSRPSANDPLVGTVQIKRFTLINAPVLAKLLEFMSLTGIVSALGQQGLDFTRMDGEFTFQDGYLNFKQAKAYGSSIAVTANGFVDSDSNFIELTGTIIPAYTFNRVLESIPVIGDILAGEDGGILAANYAVEGPIEDPTVSVNPLSALAPGILRRIFSAGEGDASSGAEKLKEFKEVQQNR